MNENEQQKLKQKITFNEREQKPYIMMASKTILSILHKGFNKIKQGGRAMVLDEPRQPRNYTIDYI